MMLIYDVNKKYEKLISKLLNSNMFHEIEICH